MKIGDVVDRYLLTEFAGESSGVRTYRAQDTVLDRSVVLRVVPSSQRRAAEAIDAARTAAQVDNQYLGRVVDVVLIPASAEGPETVAVVLEWMPGVTLAERLADMPPPSVDETILMLTCICEALDAAHQCGVFHGRVDEQAVIADEGQGFGLTGLAVDTALFGPLRTDLPGALQDLDGLGRLTYLMLTGRSLGAQETPVPPSWVRADVPGWLDDIVVGCLSTPGERPRLTSVTRIRALLPNALSTRTGRRRRVPALRLSDIARRVTAVLAGLAAVAIVAAVGLVLMRTGGQSMDAAQDQAMESRLLNAPVQRPSAGSERTSSGPDTVSSFVTVRSFTPKQPASAVPSDTWMDALSSEALDAPADGDLTSCWKSRVFRTADAGGRDGVGLMLDLGAVKDVSAVELTFAGQGSELQVRVGDERARDPRLWPLLTQAPQGDPVIELRGAEPRRGRYVLLWFPRLPAVVDQPDRFRVSVCEIGITTE